MIQLGQGGFCAKLKKDERSHSLHRCEKLRSPNFLIFRQESSVQNA